MDRYAFWYFQKNPHRIKGAAQWSMLRFGEMMILGTDVPVFFRMH